MKWARKAGRFFLVGIPWVLLGFALIIIQSFLIEACKMPAVTASNPINCLDFWLNRYQTLIGGLIAISAAWFTIQMMRAQMLHSERIARRVEDESEKAFRGIVEQRAGILAEAWKAIDWALEPKEDIEKSSRAQAICGIYADTTEERSAHENMTLLAEAVTPPHRPKLKLLLMRWAGMMEYLDQTNEQEQTPGYSYLERMRGLRYQFSFIAQALERYDPLLADVFTGCRMPHINPGDSAKRTRAIRESLIAYYEKQKAPL